MARLEVITGPMYSGKSEELMRRMRRAQIAGKKVRVFKPAIDDRYEIDKIVSHDGTTFDCIPVHTSGVDMLNLSKGFDIIGVDEAQFFGYKFQEVARVLLNRGVVLILAGLDMTYRREPFASFPYFLAVADTVDKLSAVCHKCGEDAMFTQRLVDGEPAAFTEPTILIGAQDSYEARCRNCFEVGRE